MGKNGTDTTAAIQAADTIIWRIEASLCNQCQDVCWSVEGIASGALGNDEWRTCIGWADHLQQSQALRVQLRLIGRQADKVRAREISALLRETSPTLW